MLNRIGQQVSLRKEKYRKNTLGVNCVYLYGFISDKMTSISMVLIFKSFFQSMYKFSFECILKCINKKIFKVCLESIRKKREKIFNTCF